MSNLPYKQAAIPEEFRRRTVNYSRKETPGTIVVDSDNKFLYYVLLATASLSAKMGKPGAASPRSAAWKNGRRGDRPRANRHGLVPCRPS
jgi:lipoprotein-anchoring transpeptidase ErfK/SrfK